ncbi:olfactory receptor 5B12-like [Diceros bicornis minor]|uniref:olfactory receptor 5B12-like n=1 Tax=Diceros bicornis minor TaxID=77932 RepID=UPI0026E9A619|nr:olfactory receptor 5B12-like [Diceros bicornis minor]
MVEVEHLIKGPHELERKVWEAAYKSKRPCLHFSSRDSDQRALSCVCHLLIGAAHHDSQVILTENISEVTEFILVGLTDALEMQVPLFTVFILIYFITVVGKLGMIMLILLDSRLHTPVYFFLSNLSLVDCVYASAVTPKVMVGFLTGDKIISYNACASQMFFFAVFATSESFLLASMAFDRHAAVCKPLHYTTIMTSTVCALLVTGSYICGLLQSSIHVAFTLHLPFCHSNVVNHFFCDIPPMLALSCSDSHTNEIVLLTLAAFSIFLTLLVILNSYLLIFIAILRMHSVEGQKKAFSNCASHLTTVSVFYGTIIFMCLQPTSSHSMDTDKMASVFYTMVLPMLNPLVYNLRNKEVKSAFKKVFGKAKSSLSLAF